MARLAVNKICRPTDLQFGRIQYLMNNVRTLLLTLLLWVVIILVLTWLINDLTIQLESSIVLPLPVVQVEKRR